jgi:hypothetical protein
MANLSVLHPNGILYGHMVHFVVIWYIYPVLVCCTEKNLATLHATRSKLSQMLFAAL